MKAFVFIISFVIGLIMSFIIRLIIEQHDDFIILKNDLDKVLKEVEEVKEVSFMVKCKRCGKIFPRPDTMKAVHLCEYCNSLLKQELQIQGKDLKSFRMNQVQQSLLIKKGE